VTDFVERDSVVRRIWGDDDTILVVFAGCAAEFALNRAVDWLFFTGRLPRDPLGRLVTTAAYAQDIVFADVATASAAFDRIRAAHEAVERRRGQRIPDWAHRDVLYMLIDYSERAREMLVGRLTAKEQDELYDVFFRVGTGLAIPDLPSTYAEWRVDRDVHLRRDLAYGEGTAALYAAYREHLGWGRYRLLLWLQSILTPAHVRGVLRLKRALWLRPMIRFYPAMGRLRPTIHRLVMPRTLLARVQGFDGEQTL
jgi:hypothetical protein